MATKQHLQRYDNLSSLYQFVVSNWAVAIPEIAESLNITPAEARGRLTTLRRADLVESHPREGQPDLWQSFFDVENGDTVEGAMASFHEKYPNPRTPDDTDQENTMTTSAPNKPAAKAAAKSETTEDTPKGVVTPKLIPLTRNRRKILKNLVASGSLEVTHPVYRAAYDYFVEQGLASLEVTKEEVTVREAVPPTEAIDEVKPDKDGKGGKPAVAAKPGKPAVTKTVEHFVYTVTEAGRERASYLGG